MRISPGGRTPSSRSTSHSYPSVPAGRVAVWPDDKLATLVFRQNRIFPSAAGTWILIGVPVIGRVKHDGEGKSASPLVGVSVKQRVMRPGPAEVQPVAVTIPTS